MLPFTIGQSAKVNAGLTASWITLYTQIEIWIYDIRGTDNSHESRMNCDKRSYASHLFWYMICCSISSPQEFTLYCFCLVGIYREIICTRCYNSILHLSVRSTVVFLAPTIVSLMTESEESAIQYISLSWIT